MTYTGLALLPIGLAALLAPTKYVYALFVFFAAFSATAIVNIGEGDSASGVQVWLFFGFIWIVREFAAFAYQLRTPFPRTVRRATMYLGIFVLVAAASLLMPLWINGQLQIMSPLLTDFTTTPLYFSSKNITAFVYLLFGATIAFLVARRNIDEEAVRSSIRIYLASGTFIAIWGLLQYACFLLKVTYPYYIFNNSLTPSASGYAAQFQALGVTRISSVAVESSILAQFLLTVLPFTLPAVLGTGAFFGRWIDRCCCLLIMATLIMTTSTTGYVGIVFFAGMAGLYLVKTGIIKIRHLVAVSLGSLVVVGPSVYLAYSISPAMHGLINEIFLGKATGYSALERLKTIYYAAQYFLEYPILGIGWGSAGSHDLIFKILSNTGLLGLLAYSAFIVTTTRRLYFATETKRSSPIPTEVLVMLAIIILTLTDVATGYSYVFGHYWFVCGLAMVGAYRPESAAASLLGDA